MVLSNWMPSHMATTVHININVSVMGYVFQMI